MKPNARGCPASNGCPWPAVVADCMGSRFPHRVRRASWVAGLGLGLALACVSPAVVAQTATTPLPPSGLLGALSTTPTPADIVPSLQPDLAAPEVPDTYQLGDDDLVLVFVYQMPELTSQVRLDNTGAITLPMMKNSIPAVGLTCPELAQRVSHELVAEGLARDPRVQVMVRQVMSRPIVVSGAVKYPTVLQATRPMRLTEVLARAGGLQPDSGAEAVISSNTAGPGTVLTIDLAKLMRSTDPADDPLLYGGESVRVLQARMVYATGALEKPGAFPLRTGEPISVLEALALAEGFSTSEPPDKKHAEIIRTAADGSRTVVPINLDQVLKHKAPDPLLEAGDLFYVPENGRHKALTTALSDVAQAGVIAVGYNAAAIF